MSESIEFKGWHCFSSGLTGDFARTRKRTTSGGFANRETKWRERLTAKNYRIKGRIISKQREVGRERAESQSGLLLSSTRFYARHLGKCCKEFASFCYHHDSPEFPIVRVIFDWFADFQTSEGYPFGGRRLWIASEFWRRAVWHVVQRTRGTRSQDGNRSK